MNFASLGFPIFPNIILLQKHVIYAINIVTYMTNMIKLLVQNYLNG